MSEYIATSWVTSSMVPMVLHCNQQDRTFLNGNILKMQKGLYYATHGTCPKQDSF